MATECQFLPASTKRQIPALVPCHACIDEKLMHIEIIAVNGSRAAFSIALQSAFDLSEESKIPTGVRIEMKHEAVQPVSIVVLRPTPPIRILEILKPLPRFA